MVVANNPRSVRLTPEMLDQHVAYVAVERAMNGGGDLSLRSVKEQGTHLIVQAAMEDGAVANYAAGAIASHLEDGAFDGDNAESNMHDALKSGRDQTVSATHSDAAFMAGAVRLFQDRSTSKHMDGVVGAVGPVKVDLFRRKGLFFKSYEQETLTLEPGADQSKWYLTEQDASLDNIHTRAFKFKPGDRLLVSSMAVAASANDLRNRNRMDAGMDPRQLVSDAVGDKHNKYDKGAVYIEFEKKKRKTAPAAGGAAVAAAGVGSPDGSKWSLKGMKARWDNRRASGATATGQGQTGRWGSGLATGKRGLTWVKNRYLDPTMPQQRKPLNRASAIGLAPLYYVNRKHGERMERKMIDNRRHSRYDASVSEADRDADFRKRTHRRGAAIVAFLTAAPALTYLFAGDPGEGANVDKGWDALGIPFDTGDRGQGDNSRVDYNISNRSDDLNDDPTKAHWDLGGNFDPVPEIIDGDGQNWWSWMFEEQTRTWDPGDTNLPDPREGNGTGNGNDTPAPRGTGPGWDYPRDGGGQGGEDAQEIGNFEVEADSSYIRELDQLGDQLGYTDAEFDVHDAGEVHEAAVHEFGADYIDLLDHSGADVYTICADTHNYGLSAPSQAAWASEGVEDFLRAAIDEIARKAQEETDSEKVEAARRNLRLVPGV